MQSEQIRKLRENFLDAAHEGGPLAIYDAVVLDVDADAFTCDIMLDEVEYPGIRLRAIVSEAHSIDVLPAIGSAVVVGMLGDDDYIVLAADEISSWSVTVDGTTVATDAEGIKISRGEETLKKILTDLVTAVLTIAAAKDAATLTQLLIRINTLLK